MGSVLHGDFTLTNMITPGVLDAQMNLTLSLITVSVPGCITSLLLSGDMLRYCHEELIFYTTWSPDCSCGAFNMVSWFWASSMHSSMPIINTALTLRILETGDCLKGRVRLMMAITPAYAHSYQATCLAQHFLGVPHHTFQLPKPKSRYPYLPNARSITRERGSDYRGWAILYRWWYSRC